MNEQELFTERMNGLLDLATDKGGSLSKGEVHFYLKDVLQSEDQYEFVYQFLTEKGVRIEGWRKEQRSQAAPSVAEAEKSEKKNRTKTDGSNAVEGEDFEENNESDTRMAEFFGNSGKIEDFTGIMGSTTSENSESDAEEDEEEDESDEPDSETDDMLLPPGIDASLLTEDEKRYLKYYQADLAQIEPMTDTERISLLNAFAAGDPSVLNRLVEGHLYLVMEEISAYFHAGVSVSDLIQEASIGLMEGIQSYRGLNFEAHVRYAIREALDAVTEEQQASDSVAKHLLDSIARADEATTRLSEVLGRAPTKEELAEYLHMDVDEVEILLKHSIDALTVSVSDEAYGKTEDAED